MRWVRFCWQCLLALADAVRATIIHATMPILWHAPAWAHRWWYRRTGWKLFRAMVDGAPCYSWINTGDQRS